MPAQLIQLVVAHQELPRRRLVGGGKNGVCTVRVQHDFLRHRVRLGIGDQILADLRVDVVSPVSAVEGVEADSHAVGQLVRVVGMHQDPHRGLQVVDAMEVAFRECAEVPQAGVHLFEGFGDAIFLGLVGMLGLGVVQARAVEPRQIFVVGARPITQRGLHGKRRVHRGQRRGHPLGRRRGLDGFAQLLELGLLGVEVRLKIGVGQHLVDVVIEPAVGHELVVEIERHREPVGDGSRSMLCTTTVSPSRAKASNLSSSGRCVSLPEALSVKSRDRDMLELAFRVLVETAHPDVADTVTGCWPRAAIRMALSVRFFPFREVTPESARRFSRRAAGCGHGRVVSRWR